MRCGTCGAATRPTAQVLRPVRRAAGRRRTGRSAAPRRRRTSSAGDRRIVTALFADLVDYVRLVAEHDPEDVRRQVDAALLGDGRGDRGVRWHPREVHRRRGVRRVRLAEWPRATTPFGRPIAPSRSARRSPPWPSSDRRRAAPGPDRDRDRRGRCGPSRRRRPRLVADRSGRDHGRPDPGDRPAGRDPPRRGDAPGRPQGARGRGSWAPAPPRPDAADPGRATPRRGRLPAVAAAGRAARRARGGARPAATAVRRCWAATRRSDRRRGRGRHGQVAADGRPRRARPRRPDSHARGSTTSRTAPASRIGSAAPWPRRSPTSTASTPGR